MEINVIAETNHSCIRPSDDLIDALLEVLLDIHPTLPARETGHLHAVVTVEAESLADAVAQTVERLERVEGTQVLSVVALPTPLFDERDGGPSWD